MCYWHPFSHRFREYGTNGNLSHLRHRMNLDDNFALWQFFVWRKIFGLHLRIPRGRDRIPPSYCLSPRSSHSDRRGKQTVLLSTWFSVMDIPGIERVRLLEHKVHSYTENNVFDRRRVWTDREDKAGTVWRQDLDAVHWRAVRSIDWWIWTDPWHWRFPPGKANNGIWQRTNFSCSSDFFWK